MRTLALLAALLLLAFPAWAQTLQETADQVPAQDQPGDEDQDQPGVKDQDQPGKEDQDVAISFTREEHFAQGAGGETPAYMQLGRQHITGACWKGRGVEAQNGIAPQ